MYNFTLINQENKQSFLSQGLKTFAKPGITICVTKLNAIEKFCCREQLTAVVHLALFHSALGS